MLSNGIAKSSNHAATEGASRLRGKRIVVGVTGGIAAYKACELVRQLSAEGATVRVVMTRHAQEFVGPLTFQALTGEPTHVDLFDAAREAAMGHIALARFADLVIVAPATADFIARYAHGLAPDLLGTMLLATRAPVLIAPAMNTQMWAHAAVQANMQTLRSRGVFVVGPAAGDLACGEVGAGRLSEPAEIVAAARRVLSPCDYAGLSVLVTAGPTVEMIDPVRMLTNRSSGKMGFAIAAAAAERGAHVTLVAGPCALATPPLVHRVDVRSAEAMRSVTLDYAARSHLIVMAAAVADYAPVATSATKLKKNAATMTLELTRTPDILSELGALTRRGALVGFAAETDNMMVNAAAKLAAKKCDYLVANDVSAPDAGFDVSTNRVTLFSAATAVTTAGAAGPESFGLMSKDDIAYVLLDRFVDAARAMLDADVIPQTVQPQQDAQCVPQ